MDNQNNDAAYTGGTASYNTFHKLQQHNYQSIDYDVPQLVPSPGSNTKIHPNRPESREEKVKSFYNDISLWLLSYAEKLVPDPNAGFAILAIINAYFEMIAQLQGVIVPKKWKKNDPTNFSQYQCGLQAVFEEELANAPYVVLKKLYDKVRCSTAHMMLAGDYIILNNIDKPISWSLDSNGDILHIIINPMLWVKYVHRHLEKYVSQLQQNDDLYQKFLSRYESEEGR